jgi:transcriptional regulator with XRE-family HTH domain
LAGGIAMDQTKIGSFLKKLRNEKGLTQEQLADHFNVSNRTVSRWENGNNLPDLSLLIELADFYDVEIRELLDGERKSENTDMDKIEKDTLLKIADYSNEEKEKLLRNRHGLFIAGLAGFVLALVIKALDLENTYPYDGIAGFGLGIAFGTIICGVIFTSKYALQIHNAKIRLLKRNSENKDLEKTTSSLSNSKE